MINHPLYLKYLNKEILEGMLEVLNNKKYLILAKVTGISDSLKRDNMLKKSFSYLNDHISVIEFYINQKQFVCDKESFSI